MRIEFSSEASVFPMHARIVLTFMFSGNLWMWRLSSLESGPTKVNNMYRVELQVDSLRYCTGSAHLPVETTIFMYKFCLESQEHLNKKHCYA
jgi:hypothetical protein